MIYMLGSYAILLIIASNYLRLAGTQSTDAGSAPKDAQNLTPELRKYVDGLHADLEARMEVERVREERRKELQVVNGAARFAAWIRPNMGDTGSWSGVITEATPLDQSQIEYQAHSFMFLTEPGSGCQAIICSGNKQVIKGYDAAGTYLDLTTIEEPLEVASVPGIDPDGEEGPQEEGGFNGYIISCPKNPKSLNCNLFKRYTTPGKKVTNPLGLTPSDEARLKSKRLKDESAQEGTLQAQAGTGQSNSGSFDNAKVSAVGRPGTQINKVVQAPRKGPRPGSNNAKDPPCIGASNACTGQVWWTASSIDLEMGPRGERAPKGHPVGSRRQGPKDGFSCGFQRGLAYTVRLPNAFMDDWESYCGRKVFIQVPASPRASERWVPAWVSGVANTPAPNLAASYRLAKSLEKSAGFKRFRTLRWYLEAEET